MKKYCKIRIAFSNLNKKIITFLKVIINNRLNTLKNKMLLQNIVVKLEKRFLYKEKHFLIMRLRIKQFIFLLLTTEMDNLMRFYGWCIPYTLPPTRINSECHPWKEILLEVPRRCVLKASCLAYSHIIYS